jgi:hypothetical protein
MTASGRFDAKIKVFASGRKARKSGPFPDAQI